MDGFKKVVFGGLVIGSLLVVGGQARAAWPDIRTTGVIFIGILGIFEAIDAISELTDEICIMILRISGAIAGNCGGTTEM